jgi:DNA polymerase-3 subunit delta'
MSWSHVLGHDAAIASLTAAWRKGRLGHAYLFAGPAGVGKHTFAREFAKALLCEDRGDRLDACDKCAACSLVDAGTHPDLFMVCRPEEALEFPIRVIKEEVLPSLAMKPARGGRKVAILDDADDLNEEAANSFLKTLEEPPPGSVLILIGGPNVEGQLPTILSRCQVIRFSPLPAALMHRVLEAQGVAEPERRERLLRLAGGSPGQALALDDEEVWKFRRKLLETLAGPRIDPVAAAGAWMEFIENAGKDAAAHRARASLIFRMLILLLEAALKVNIGAPAAGDAEEAKFLRKIGESFGEELLLRLIERALEADLQVERRVQLVLSVEAFLDTLGRERPGEPRPSGRG